MSDGGGWSLPWTVDEALRTLGGAIADVVPPEAQTHLLNAQRELLLAVAAIVDHNWSRTGGAGRGERGAGKPSRVEID